MTLAPVYFTLPRRLVPYLGHPPRPIRVRLLQLPITSSCPMLPSILCDAGGDPIRLRNGDLCCFSPLSPPPPPPPPPPPRYEDCMRHPSSCTADVNVTPVTTDDTEAFVIGGSSPAPPPTYARHVARAADGVGRSSDGATREGAGVIDDSAVKMEFRRKRWALFVAGNLISVAVVVSEICQLRVCFHHVVIEADDGDIADLEASLLFSAQYTRGLERFMLVFGLWTEIVSAVGLSLIYRSPLDIKSVHKIPPEDMRHCGGTAIVYFLAPFSWGVIYLTGGVASMFYVAYSFCEGRGGSELRTYLWFSGAGMFFSALAMLGLSVFIVLFLCGSPARCADKCCAKVRRTYVRRILSKAAFLDLYWQVQGAVWAYRSGGLGVTACILVGVFGVVGQILAEVGSLAPDVVQELVGPLP